MDHQIDYVEEYMKFDVEEFRKEMKNSTNKKMSDCPSYATVTAGLIMSAGAMNHLTFITGVILLMIGLSV